MLKKKLQKCLVNHSENLRDRASTNDLAQHDRLCNAYNIFNFRTVKSHNDLISERFIESNTENFIGY